MPYTVDKSEPGALPGFLRREERLEDALAHFVRSCRRRCRVTLARRTPPVAACRPVRDRERRPPSGIASRALTARLSSTCSSCAAVGAHARQRRLDSMSQLDVLADDAPQHRLRCRRRRRRGRARVGCSTCLRLNASSWCVRFAARSDASTTCSQIVGRRVSSAGAHQRELRVAGDDRDEIVEVVRDAAGERADRLELLRLAELRLALAQRLLDASSLADLVGEHDVRRGQLGVRVLQLSPLARRANPSAG